MWELSAWPLVYPTISYVEPPSLQAPAWPPPPSPVSHPEGARWQLAEGGGVAGVSGPAPLTGTGLTLQIESEAAIHYRGTMVGGVAAGAGEHCTIPQDRGSLQEPSPAILSGGCPRVQDMRIAMAGVWAVFLPWTIAGSIWGYGEGGGGQ